MSEERSAGLAARQAALGVPIRLTLVWHGSGFHPGIKHTRSALDGDGNFVRVHDHAAPESGVHRQAGAAVLVELWDVLRAAGFPEIQPKRPHCYPDEATLELELELASETVVLSLPSGEGERTPGWSEVIQRLREIAR